MARVVAYNSTDATYLSGRRFYAKWKSGLQSANVYKDTGSARVQATNMAPADAVIQYLPITITLNPTPIS